MRAGQMFADADLLGVPIRVVLSPRNLKENKIEISTRDKSVQESVDLAAALDYILAIKIKMYAKIQETE